MVPLIIVGLIFAMGIFAMIADDVDSHKDDWRI